ncbi:MAG: GGDEF domain-containing protein [Burkholderiaceae bacterium]|nr:GGDEF domain-containing protein [Burkholderiaceae bacterium]
MLPHVPTLLLMTILVCVLMALSMVTVGWGARHEGLHLWAAGLGINALAYGLFVLRPSVGEPISIVLGNAMTSLALSCLLAAVLRFQGRTPHWALLVLPAAVLAGAMLALLDDFHQRVLAASAVLGLQSALIMRALQWGRRSTVGRGALLLMAGMGLLLLVMLVRGLDGLTGLVSRQGFLQDGAMQTLTFVATLAVALVASMGFVFMTKERADEANRVLAALDALTGVANRRSIIAALDRDAGRAIRARTPLAVMMIDLDHFKRINDSHGHLAGDAVLRSLVRVLGDRLRSQDLVGRYGGEEFLVVLPETTLSGARRLANELCQAVEAHAFVHAGQPIPLTVSIGVFGGLLEPGDHWDLLIHAADSALYAAKRAGRNRVEQVAVLPRTGPHGAGPETFPASLS